MLLAASGKNYALMVTVIGLENLCGGMATAALLALPLLAGLTMAFIQITAIDVFRFWMTGTWGAFPLK